jgi:hypothetical protein
MQDIQVFKDLHKGKRGFIVATGPSLNDTPVKKLRGEIVFGLNRAYLKSEISFSYMLTIAEAVERHYGQEIVNLPVHACFGGRTLQTYPNKGNVYQLHWSQHAPAFSTDLTKPIRQGHTVTYVAMQVAYYMGLAEVYTIGLDHYFEYPKDKYKKLRKGVASLGEDINHFSSDYFKEGDDHLRAEPLVTQEYYRVAQEYYENSGRILANASVRTALGEEYLPQVDFDSLF